MAEYWTRPKRQDFVVTEWFIAMLVLIVQPVNGWLKFASMLIFTAASVRWFRMTERLDDADRADLTELERRRGVEIWQPQVALRALNARDRRS